MISSTTTVCVIKYDNSEWDPCIQVLDPEFGGAGNTGDPELLAAALDLVEWMHTQTGVPAATGGAEGAVPTARLQPVCVYSCLSSPVSSCLQLPSLLVFRLSVCLGLLKPSLKPMPRLCRGP